VRLSVLPRQDVLRFADALIPRSSVLGLVAGYRRLVPMRGTATAEVVASESVPTPDGRRATHGDETAVPGDESEDTASRDEGV
ncbi:hypothetical protein C6A85_15850, partial [Mycobacterium sp. ITM-2017-0098]